MNSESLVNICLVTCASTDRPWPWENMTELSRLPQIRSKHKETGMGEWRNASKDLSPMTYFLQWASSPKASRTSQKLHHRLKNQHSPQELVRRVAHPNFNRWWDKWNLEQCVKSKRETEPMAQVLLPQVLLCVLGQAIAPPHGFHHLKREG